MEPQQIRNRLPIFCSLSTTAECDEALGSPFEELRLSIESEASTVTSPRGEVRGKKEPVNPVQRGHFQIHLDLVASGEDERTSVMIKNIPNKYTQKMLLQSLDQHLAGQYDFLYLPIDFKNRCNMGYAFVNFKRPASILVLARLFEGQGWERFNSDKVCELAYARIQGKQALVAHFESSSIMGKNSAKVKPLVL